jgi:hypothetical protein
MARLDSNRRGGNVTRAGHSSEASLDLGELSLDPAECVA